MRTLPVLTLTIVTLGQGGVAQAQYAQHHQLIGSWENKDAEYRLDITSRKGGFWWFVEIGDHEIKPGTLLLKTDGCFAIFEPDASNKFGAVREWCWHSLHPDKLTSTHPPGYLYRIIEN